MLYKILCIFVLVITVAAIEQKCNNGIACIDLENCVGLNNQLRRGSNTYLLDLLRSLTCGYNGLIPKVCCPPEYQIDSQPTRFYGDNPPETSGPFLTPTDTGIHTTGISGSSSSSLLPNNKECGIQTSDRIVGGKRTELDEHPWMALLRYDKPKGWGFYCGGVLISSRYVMTAAHCVKGHDLPRTWRLSQVRLGEWNKTSTRDCLGSECVDNQQLDVPVEEIIAHEGYNPSDPNQHNDIALLRLARPVQSTDFVKPICLPVPDTQRTNNFVGYDMEVVGWGKTESTSESDVKLKVRVPVVSTSECGNVYQRVQRRITNNQICAGGGQEDSCRGDSGGPLMGQVSNLENWIAVGVVSYGPSPCGSIGWPGVYTRVGAYIDWIMSKLRA